MAFNRAVQSVLSRFLSSEKTGGILLICCTIISLIIANSNAGAAYSSLWLAQVAGESVVHWINDGLMTIFFLLIGLELKREIREGELSSLRNALLPVFAAAGGMIVPAAIYFAINNGTPTEGGAGIPMATDIAFALGVLSILGSRVPVGLKIFLTALAVIDDLGAILVIAFFYTADVHLDQLGISLAIWCALFLMQRMKVNIPALYILGGIGMWYFMLHSGVHATITGVLLAFVIPVSNGSRGSLSDKIQHLLHLPVAFIILPLFALANTCIVLEPGWTSSLLSDGAVGIMAGLTIGKPVGIIVFSSVAIATRLGSMPAGVSWKHLMGAGLLAGIGFTMSIFISLLAFDNLLLVTQAKIAILVASCLAAIAGIVWLGFTTKK